MKNLTTTLRHGMIGLCAVFGIAGVGHACSGELFKAAQDAVSEDAKVAQAGLDVLLANKLQAITAVSVALHQDLKEMLPSSDLDVIDGFLPEMPSKKEYAKIKARHARIKFVFAQITQQHNGHISKLNWFTDLNEAKKLSARLNRPILSLRLLGNLTDEYSCANSRFFRSVLYSNTELSNYLRSNYVLHWESVRPVPKVTIDFGDGRVVRQTVTGNSIHYVLDSKGRILDALPGLYDPKTFRSILKEKHTQFASLKDLDDKAFAHTQKKLISSKYDSLATAFNGIESGKSFATLTVADFTPELLDELVPEGYVEDALDQMSTRIIRAQFPPARRVAQRAMAKAAIEVPFFRAVNAFKRNVVHDTIRNQYAMRAPLLTWLGANPAVNVDEFNDRVYRDMFHTPADDPWLGLYTDEIYTGLENGGITLVAPKKALLTH